MTMNDPTNKSGNKITRKSLIIRAVIVLLLMAAIALVVWNRWHI